MNKKTKNKSQEIQDKIFKKMSANRKIEIGSMLWQLAKDIIGNKIKYWNKKYNIKGL